MLIWKYLEYNKYKKKKTNRGTLKNQNEFK